MVGRILKGLKGLYFVDGENGEICSCRSATKVRKSGVMPLAGDIVEYEPNGFEGGFIVGVKERKNFFVRPPVANIDVLAIVMAVTNPKPLFYNIDKLTVAAEASGVDVWIIINKTDLGCGAEIENNYESAGYRCFNVSALKSETDYLKLSLEGKTTVFAGASGVGKSSLLNAMFPDFKLETGELSERIMRGKNTTRHSELFKVGNNTYIGDTPGFTRLEVEKKIFYEEKDVDFKSLLSIDAKELWRYFPEMREKHGKCRWRDCYHTKEDGCAVKEAVDNGSISPLRYESYLKMYKSLI